MTIQVISTPETPVQAVEPGAKADGVQSELAGNSAGQTDHAAPDTATKEEESEEGTEAAGDEHEAEDGDKGDAEKPKKKSGSQRLRERAQRAEAELERLRRVVETTALKNAGEPKTEPKAEANTANQDGEPQAGDFDTHADYVRAVTKWEIKQDHKAREAEAEKARLRAEHETRLSAHSERVKAFSEKTEDFMDVLDGVDDIVPTLAVQEAILTSEISPQLMYELAKNKAEYERINALPPLAAARAIGKLEASLAQPPEAKKPETKKTTSAPKPIAPVGAKGGPVEKSLHDAASSGSQAEYEALRRKQMKQRAASW